MDTSVRGGDFSWPKTGTFRGHQRGHQLAKNGDFLMATDIGRVSSTRTTTTRKVGNRQRSEIAGQRKRLLSKLHYERASRERLISWSIYGPCLGADPARNAGFESGVAVTAGEERSFRLAPTCPFSILLYESASFSVFSLTLWRCLFQVSTYDGTKQSYGKKNESPDSIPKSSKKNGEAHNEFLPSYLAANPPVDVRNGSTEGAPYSRERGGCRNTHANSTGRWAVRPPG